MSRASKSAPKSVPRCPWALVEILQILGLLRQELRNWEASTKEVQEAIDWISRGIHQLTGIPRGDILETINRLASGKDLEGVIFPKSIPDLYKRDLTHVLRALHELDKSRVTKAKIWRGLYERCASVRNLYRPPKRRITSGEANYHVSKWLRKHAAIKPRAVTIKGVQAGIKQDDNVSLSTGTIQMTPAWRAFHEARKSRQGGQLRIVSQEVSAKVMSGKPDDTEDNPSIIAERNEDEETWKRILEKATSSERRALMDMNETKRQELIEQIRQSFRDQAADNP